MKHFYHILCMVFICMTMNAQITFNACNSIIENQNYTFNLKSADVTGRNVFETNPVNGDQNCGGIGVCEMQVAWNDTESRWEIFADDGNGGFSNTYVLYYNTEASTPNPPSLILGTWIENTSITNSMCVDGIMTLSGNVQDTTLEISDEVITKSLTIFPNPATEVVFIKSTDVIIKNVTVTDINGRIIFRRLEDFERIDVSRWSPGMYFLTIQSRGFNTTKKIIIN